MLERLFRGSILNYRTFFFDEEAEVNMRFVTDSVLKVLSKSRLDKIATTNETLEQRFSKFKLGIAKENKRIPLDYIMALPSQISKRLI